MLGSACEVVRGDGLQHSFLMDSWKTRGKLVECFCFGYLRQVLIDLLRYKHVKVVLEAKSPPHVRDTIDSEAVRLGI